jgi:hypothetical protein
VVRTAACRCGALTATCEGEPVRVSVCHCLACQRRTGSAFSAQARFPAEKVRLEGAVSIYVRTADSGNKFAYRFCPACGSTVAYEGELQQGLIAIPLGAFADPGFPPPRFSVWESRRHPWAAVTGEEVDHTD